MLFQAWLARRRLQFALDFCSSPTHSVLFIPHLDGGMLEGDPANQNKGSISDLVDVAVSSCSDVRVRRSESLHH